jgi:hypothetical protein
VGNYSFSNVFSKEPAVIAGAVRSVLYVLVVMGLWVIDEKALAAIALALEVLLTLFVRQSSTSTADPQLTLGQSVRVEGRKDEPPPDAVVALVEDVAPGAGAVELAPLLKVARPQVREGETADEYVKRLDEWLDAEGDVAPL